MLGIYVRTSNAKTNKNDFSIEDQTVSGIKLAKSLNIPYEIYEDKGITGTDENRPSLLRLLKDIKKKKITHFYAIDQARVERKLGVWVLFSGECINHKVEFYLGNQKIELTDPQSMFNANIMSLINSFYAEVTSQKVKSANRLKVSKGKTHGVKALGIGRDENNNFREIPHESKIVREIFDLSINGVGVYEIANKMTTRGYITKSGNKKWSGSTINGILKNKIYKGEFWFSRGDIENRVRYDLDFHIIDPLIFDKVQDFRSNKMIKSGVKNKYSYLLSDKMICGQCGGVHKYVGMHKPSSRTSVYRCSNRNHQVQIECRDSINLTIKKFDTFIVNLIFLSTIFDDVLSKTYSQDQRKKELGNQIKKSKGDLKNLKTRKTKLLNFIDTIDDSQDEDLHERFNNVVKEISQLENDICLSENELLIINTNNPVDEIKEIQQLNYKNISKQQLKDIVNKTINYIKIHSQFSTNEFIVEIMFSGFPTPLMFHSTKIMDQFNLLLPKNPIQKNDLLNKLEENHTHKFITPLLENAKFIDLKMNQEDYLSNADYVDDLALEYEVIKDTPFDINDYTINLKELQLIDYIN